MANGNGGNIVNFVGEGFMGAVAGFAGDALTEVSRVPFLNDAAPIGGATMSNYEIITYGLGGLMATLGFVDLVTKRSPVGGFGKHLLSTGLGLIIGTNQYESWGAEKLGIRK